MQFVPMAELLQDAYAKGYAVPSFTFWGAEGTAVILRVAERMRAPVILMNGPSEFLVLTPRDHGAIAHRLSDFSQARAALLLDHGDSLEQVQACLDAGYTSTMLDFSSRPLEENIAAMQQVVTMANPRGATVEGEIGVVGRVGAAVEGGKDSSLTDPTKAADYVARTGVDALAVSIGNAHGAYTALPQFDFDLLAELREAVSVPLVLHGGSGTPPEDLKRAISLGIAKVNVATELVMALRGSLTKQWEQEPGLWLPLAMVPAMEALGEVVAKWIRLTGAEGKA